MFQHWICIRWDSPRLAILSWLKEIKVLILKLEQMTMKWELVEETRRKMNHNKWQLHCITLMIILDLHTPNLREWFSISFKTSTWHKMHIMLIAQQGSKTWMTSCIMFMTFSLMSTTETTLGMSEGDGS